MLERGAQVNGSASDSLATETPLHVAAAAGNIRIIELLMAYGASPFSAAMRNDTTSAIDESISSAIFIPLFNVWMYMYKTFERKIIEKYIIKKISSLPTCPNIIEDSTLT